MSQRDATVLSFALNGGWIVTLEHKHLEAAYNRLTGPPRARNDAIAEALWGQK